MNWHVLTFIALAFAAIPCGLFLLNLFAYRRLPLNSEWITDKTGTGKRGGISVLIPARNEEHNLPALLATVLANRNCQFEVVVLDDHSTDQTAAIIHKFAQRDPRVRCESAPPLPPGWCGKQHACHHLARLARHPLLLFIDADVRLATDALSRMTSFMHDSGAQLASSVPRQELLTFSERLLIPLIHFILLGYLPIHFMRRTRMPGLSGGCGQLFLAQRDAYAECGGHAMIRGSLHDGIQLPRLFRRYGFKTDLFDATDLATCRMYHTNRETWRGLAKNAAEGLGAPATIIPMTVLLLGGQVLPFALLGCSAILPPTLMAGALVACALAYLPRFLAIKRFRQPFGSAILHPFGIIALLAIQWHALIRRATGKSSEWKGRQYTPTVQPQTAKST